MSREQPTHRLPRACELLLRSARAWVPRPHRAAFEREWRGELAWALRSGSRGPLSLTTRAAWAHLDALWLRLEEISMQRLTSDLRLALRGFRQRPGFAAVALLTLALAIGANTAVFTVVDGVLLRPLEYPDSERLVSVNLSAEGLDYPFVPLSDGFFVLLQEESRALQAVAMSQFESLNVVDDGNPTQIPAARITPSTFEVLRVPPALGRAFRTDDREPGAEPVVILSDELWRTRYGADPAILDTFLDLDGVRRRVVGVMPAGFAFPNDEVRAWTPYEIDEANLSPGAFSNPGIGRLVDGATLEGLRDDVRTLIGRVSERFADELPAGIVEQARFAPLVTTAKERLVGDLRLPMLVVLGTVGLVLLIACANLANLFLVRAELRQREITVRAAMGAGRLDIARLFLTESLLLAITGGLVGLALAAVGVRAFTAAAPVAIPRLASVSLDGRVLLFCAAVSLLTGLLFGAVPALRMRAGELASSLREGGRSATSGRGTLLTRDALVVAQVSLALLLLVSSGLMLRSFDRLRSVDPGFVTEGVVTMRIALPGAQYPTTGERVAFWNELLERVRGLSGVESAGAINHVPLGDGRANGSLYIEDFPTDEDAMPPLAERKLASPGALETLGVPLLEGRRFEPGDRADGFRAVVVSRSFARHWWPDESALGKRLRDDGDEEWWTIVGVVGDVHYQSLELPAEETVYYPTTSGTAGQPDHPGALNLLVRGAGDPEARIVQLRDVIWQIDSRQPIARARPLSRLLDDAMARTSFTMTLLGIAASMAMLIGAIGIYGVISYLVNQRIPEIGIRLALGASGRNVRRLVIRRGLVLTAIGMTIGIAGSLAAGRALRGLLYEVTVTDPLTYAAVIVLVAAVALAASWIPAMRASRISPVRALRQSA